MTEQFSSFNEFDSAAAADALGAESRPMRDVAHGQGEALSVRNTELEVYPSAGVARVTTEDARIELYRVPRYTVSGERVVFEQGTEDDRTRLLVRADGNVSFYPVLRATEPPRTAEPAPAGRQDSPTPSTASETPTASYDKTAADPEGKETPQVQLRGRLGRDPWYSDQGEQPMGGFPLAVNDERGDTTWHRVVVFDETAQQLHQARAQIRKGRLVDVTGQHVVREEPKASGGVRKTREFHATALTRVTSTPKPR